MAGVQLNSVFLFSPSQAMSESRIFEQNKHFLLYENSATAFVYKFVKLAGPIIEPRRRGKAMSGIAQKF